LSDAEVTTPKHVYRYEFKSLHNFLIAPFTIPKMGKSNISKRETLIFILKTLKNFKYFSKNDNKIVSQIFSDQSMQVELFEST
jgi:hypothetical protein